MPTYKWDKDKREIVQISEGTSKWGDILLTYAPIPVFGQFYGPLVRTLVEPVPPPSEPEAKHTQRAVVGWRGWVLCEDGAALALGSVSQKHHGKPWRWGGPVVTADKPPRGIDTDRHGLWAMRRKRQVRVSGYNFDVIGEVLLFGRVVVHREGYRAEKAMIRRLILPRIPGYRADVDALASRYACEVSEDLKWRKYHDPR